MNGSSLPSIHSVRYFKNRHTVMHIYIKVLHALHSNASNHCGNHCLLILYEYTVYDYETRSICSFQSSTMTEHENECKPLGWRLLFQTPYSPIITSLIFSFSGHSEKPSSRLNGCEMQAMSEEVIFWFLWCRGFV